MRYNGRIFQIGGNETIGKGFARLKVVNPEKKRGAIKNA